jgi:hypothetical protein
LERLPTGVRDPKATDFDHLSAYPDRLQLCNYESLSHKDTEHCERKSAGEHHRLGDAVHTRTGHQGKSAALVETKVR